ncbi:MetQ/NlpA family ABC transporter substrate-binding protein [uncultured Parasutterella sp.]|uniref:MetQ/NlpA family ABC transporter substrate-binding protein n=1 Tax=uncultured Parasutterella sp. TaxID=1263098 RepID=UPI0025B64F3D|nr:MetQ/NlpA family ABC transporter substrate-binding protein [uncultured Parasutterella sp.]
MSYSKKLITIITAASLFSLGLTALNVSAAEKLKEIRVGVTGDYNAQWDTINKLHSKEGLKVKLVKYSDYATPNRALNDGDIDLNAFQHKAFLENDRARNGYKIEAIGDTIVTPIRLFNNKSKIKSVADIKDGDIIGIPSDLTNGGRALKLLEAAGLIELDPSKGVVPTKADITKYNKKIVIREAESGILFRLLPDLSAAVINGGNAFTARLDPVKDAIFSEDVNPKTNPHVSRLVNAIVARSANKDNPDYRKVVKAYQTPEVAQTLKDAYKGGYIPAWEGADQYKLK